MEKKSRIQMKFDTQDTRLALHQLVEEGVPVHDALKKVLPNDKNRKNKLRAWENNHLWPVPADDLRIYEQQKRLGKRKRTRTEEVLEPQEPRPVQVVEDREALNVLVDLYRSGKLTELLAWYETTKGEVILVRTPERRPLFRGEAKNTGIKISGDIMERALEKARAERHKVGGSLSKLVEYLLWCYIGSPAELIEGND